MTFQRVIIEKLRNLNFKKPVGLELAEKFLRESLTLQDKKIAGRFVEFDDKDPSGDTLLVIDLNDQYRPIPIKSVVTLVENWVVVD